MLHSVHLLRCFNVMHLCLCLMLETQPRNFSCWSYYACVFVCSFLPFFFSRLKTLPQNPENNPWQKRKRKFKKKEMKKENISCDNPPPPYFFFFVSYSDACADQILGFLSSAKLYIDCLSCALALYTSKYPSWQAVIKAA